MSFGLGLIGCIVLALAKSVGVLIGMRCVQAAGYVHVHHSPCSCNLNPELNHRFNSASAVFAIGAAKLADIYDPEVRGSMMGIYYSYVQ